jgi:ABC-type multidrug transport system fused ATPase/permease subunit
VEFKEVTMKYREDLPLVLDGVSFKIKPREKIGVVGRTGSGKSSLLQVLFRMVEPSSGTVFIDGQDIGAIGLDDLRSRLAIIPQDPTLFTGTVRTNLDPIGKFEDEQLWEVIESVNLKEQILEMEAGLDSPISEYGESLSEGTRQLMCLARAMLRRSKILVMDEATASVDFTTDELIQNTIRKDLSAVTVIIIAHRINSILDCDRVMVMDAGKVVEFDSPKKLLGDKKSVFYTMANEAGLGEESLMGKRKHEERKKNQHRHHKKPVKSDRMVKDEKSEE